MTSTMSHLLQGKVTVSHAQAKVIGYREFVQALLARPHTSLTDRSDLQTTAAMATAVLFDLFGNILICVAAS